MLTGCSAMTTVQPDGTIAYRHFGYLKVISPNKFSTGKTPISATNIETVGIKVGNGVGIGYFHDKQIVVPLDCHTVFLVSNQEQLDKAISTLNDVTKMEGTCEVIYKE